MSGARLNAADLLYCGLATDYVASASLPALEAALAQCSSSADVAPLLAQHGEGAPGQQTMPSAAHSLSHLTLRRRSPARGPWWIRP